MALGPNHTLQRCSRYYEAGLRAAEGLRQGRHGGGRLAACLDVHQCDDLLDVVVRYDCGRSRKVGLVDRAARQGYAPQGPLLGGLPPLHRLAPRGDLDDAPFPGRVPGLSMLKAVRLHRRRRGQQGQTATAVGYTGRGVALAWPAAATTHTAPGRDT